MAGRRREFGVVMSVGTWDFVDLRARRYLCMGNGRAKAVFYRSTTPVQPLHACYPKPGERPTLCHPCMEAAPPDLRAELALLGLLPVKDRP